MPAVFGLEVEELPEGWQPLEVVVLVKCLKPDDSIPVMSMRGTDGMTSWEVVGALRCFAADIERQFLDELD